MHDIGWESFVIGKLFYYRKKIVTLWYRTVRLVRRTEGEKYGTYIWVVLLLPNIDKPVLTSITTPITSIRPRFPFV
jgi:hypothetical protein